jgi:pSer/pThr/pTyr-binding forkhead associated (FHA) protein
MAMRKEQEDRIDPTRPVLLVLYGATRKKCRPLTGDLVVLGRHPGCDIGLVSPEVAPVHCIIARVGGSWRIRDCSGRATRVNGRTIDDGPLTNGDVIQVGTFSFEAHLPPAPLMSETDSHPGETLAPAQ